MNVFACSKCGRKWTENYCPLCAQTIERWQTPKPSFLPRTAMASAATKEIDTGEKEEFVRLLKAATPDTWVTFLLIGLNIFVFLVLSLKTGKIFDPPTFELIKWGADFGPLTVNDNQWWRLLNSCFLHLGIVHLLFNMYALLLAGGLTERLFGSWFFLVIYLGCGLVASLTSLWFNPMSVSVGASGAIFGVYGALLGYLSREKGGLPKSLVAPVTKAALIFVGWNLINGLLSMMHQATQQILDSINHTQSSGSLIDMAAHAGGLFAGLILGFMAARPLQPGPRKALASGRAFALGLGICLLMAVVSIPLQKANPPDMLRTKLLGEMYLRGEGVKKNPALAVNWLGRAADQGDENSQLLLGLAYYTGEGVPKDILQAVPWLIKAGDQGDTNAERMLAGIYLHGEGVPTNTPEAIKWFTKLADQGDIKVQKILAGAYFKGDALVGQNTAEGMKWARRVGEQGDLDYQIMLATCYFRGEGVEVDKSEAAKWYLLAANQGDPGSQKAIGLMYAAGDGTEKNPVEALKWLTLGGGQGVAIARVRRDLENELTSVQMIEVRKTVKYFLRTHAEKPSR